MSTSCRSSSLVAILALSSVLAAACAGPGDGDGKIIISGASGNLGGLTVDALLEMGVPASQLILVSRTPESLADYAALGASTRYGDFTVPESLPAAYAGGERMLLISIGGGNLPEPRAVLHQRAIDAAIAAGVEHIAYTSWAAISRGDMDGISADHVATEEILAASGVSWTYLRNSVYMDGIPAQAAGMVEAGAVAVPANDVGMSYVTRADCAAAAAAVLATAGHDNAIYDITGPEVVGLREIARAAADVSGVAIDIRTADASANPGFGVPSLGFVSPDFERLTGRAPTSIRQLLAQTLRPGQDTAAVLPDFTGVWTWNLEPGENPVQTLRAQAEDLPFRPEVAPRIEEYKAMAALSLENPGSMCVQFGMPQAMLFSGGYPMEVIQRPEQVTVIFEAYSEVRRIFIEPHPYDEANEWPSLIGFSSAYWDQDTLVVRTSRLKEQLSGDFPHSENAVFEERYRLVSAEDGTPVIVNDWTLTDPAFYTEPVSRQREWKPLGNERHLHEYACMEDQWLEREAYLLERYRAGNPVIANQPDETGAGP